MNAMLVSFDIANIFPSIEQNICVAGVKCTLDSTSNLSPFSENMLKALEICLANKNSVLAD